ncbi:glycosyl hydrolase 53 family protein [Gracilinema caldarium]|uniref:glycosyl hydrolase 53 family protein n=1 Tax=Gracilinema caldarium TaxID=215591 RepID=UPI0026F00FBB|nr:glycosyl hydrolase 53 family protein [Gracilinema caldarium]
MKTHYFPLYMIAIASTILLLFSCANLPNNEAVGRSMSQQIIPVDTTKDYQIFVKPVQNLPDDFIMGMDISSIIALEKSGVLFRNEQGEVQDIFKTLSEAGINSIRVRIWNDPFTADGKGYGGGNNDIKTAIEIGKRATQWGMSVLFDYHYSDFWADPSKQQAPKAWKTLSIEKKEKALYEYTKKTLKMALDAGVNVKIVQIGNETTGVFCGENNWIRIGTLMQAGSRAVREISKERKRAIQIAIHFTNPEKAGEYERYVKILEKQNVDYDIFASSYYPYWHGSVQQFAEVLKNTAKISGKKVMCVETSYAYTYEDGDGFPNTISRDSVVEKPYPITVQGQANAIRDTIAAVASVGNAGIGVYYWEGAWIPVPGKNKEERQMLWEKYGSGWAASYSVEYDAKDAGVYYGGSSWDNQAQFDFTGKPLASLSVWKLIRYGSKTAVRPDSAEELELRVRLGDAVTLPETIKVIMNDGSIQNMEVLWDSTAIQINTGPNYGKIRELNGISHGPVSDYLVYGNVIDEFSNISPVRALLRLSIVEKNYVENPSFEDKNLSMWRIENIDGITTELFVQEKVSDAKTGAKALHFWSKNKVAFRVEQTVRGLAPGLYKLSMTIHGGDAKNPNMYLYAISNGSELRTETTVDGWRNFKTPVIPKINVTDGTVIIGAYISCDANGWGSLDDFILSPLQE